MGPALKRIELGGVAGFLLEAGDGFVLVDTGFAKRRARLEASLMQAGCIPGRLSLILLTHGDVDHTGNARYLRDTYGAPIAIHAAEVPVLSTGDQTANRGKTPDKYGFFFRILGLFDRPDGFETFEPNLLVDESTDLAPYGLDARILHLPGHSRGSIGLVLATGDAICGDLLVSFPRPRLHFLIDDLAAARSSVEKLRQVRAGMIHPSHGRPFPAARLPH